MTENALIDALLHEQFVSLFIGILTVRIPTIPFGAPFGCLYNSFRSKSCSLTHKHTSTKESIEAHAEHEMDQDQAKQLLGEGGILQAGQSTAIKAHTEGGQEQLLKLLVPYMAYFFVMSSRPACCEDRLSTHKARIRTTQGLPSRKSRPRRPTQRLRGWPQKLHCSNLSVIVACFASDRIPFWIPRRFPKGVRTC